MDCLNTIEQLFPEIQKIEWNDYNNHRYTPQQIIKMKVPECNCVDRAFMVDQILYCNFKLPCRFVYAHVLTHTGEADHIWPQILCDGQYIDFDANSPYFNLGDTFEIKELHGYLADLSLFGCPPLICPIGGK